MFFWTPFKHVAIALHHVGDAVVLLVLFIVDGRVLFVDAVRGDGGDAAE